MFMETWAQMATELHNLYVYAWLFIYICVYIYTKCHHIRAGQLIRVSSSDSKRQIYIRKICRFKTANFTVSKRQISRFQNGKFYGFHVQRRLSMSAWLKVCSQSSFEIIAITRPFLKPGWKEIRFPSISLKIYVLVHTYAPRPRYTVCR